MRLATSMTSADLYEKGPWRELEELRSTPTGTLFVFRPVHTRLDPPSFESTVEIDTDACPLQPSPSDTPAPSRRRRSG